VDVTFHKTTYRGNVLVIALLVSLGCAKEDSIANRGSQFTAPDRAFSIQFSGEVKHKTIELAPGYASEMYFVDEGKRAYVVMRSPIAKEPAEIEELLNRGRDRAVARAKGVLVDERELDISGHLGREFAIAMPNGLVQRVRIIPVESELFQLIVACPKGEESSQATSDFFKSFLLSQELDVGKTR
jgi:hypothetical protein